MGVNTYPKQEETPNRRIKEMKKQEELLQLQTRMALILSGEAREIICFNDVMEEYTEIQEIETRLKQLTNNIKGE